MKVPAGERISAFAIVSPIGVGIAIAIGVEGFELVPF
jgi:hypothetical protein